MLDVAPEQPVEAVDASDVLELVEDDEGAESARCLETQRQVEQGVERGERVARRIDAGAVCVNDAALNYLALELPMGGWKSSGLGSRHGAGGIRKYTRQQSLLVTRLAPKRDLHMFPYKARTTGLLGRAMKLLYGRGKRD